MPMTTRSASTSRRWQRSAWRASCRPSNWRWPNGSPICADRRDSGRRPRATTRRFWRRRRRETTRSARRASCASSGGRYGRPANATRPRPATSRRAHCSTSPTRRSSAPSLLQERGRLAFRSGDHEAAARWADKALGMPKLRGRRPRARPAWRPPVPLRRRSTRRAWRWRGWGSATRRCARWSAACRWPKRPASTNVACRAYTNLGVLYSLLDPARAIDVCRRGLEVATRIGDLGFQARL